MPGTVGSAPLLSPWYGMAGLLNGSSDQGVLLAAALCTMALVGIVLAFYGGHVHQPAPAPRAAAVHVARTIKPGRRRRRQPHRRP